MESLKNYKLVQRGVSETSQERTSNEGGRKKKADGKALVVRYEILHATVVRPQRQKKRKQQTNNKGSCMCVVLGMKNLSNFLGEGKERKGVVQLRKGLGLQKKEGGKRGGKKGGGSVLAALRDLNPPFRRIKKGAKRGGGDRGLSTNSP